MQEERYGERRVEEDRVRWRNEKWDGRKRGITKEGEWIKRNGGDGLQGRVTEEYVWRKITRRERGNTWSRWKQLWLLAVLWSCLILYLTSPFLPASPSTALTTRILVPAHRQPINQSYCASRDRRPSPRTKKIHQSFGAVFCFKFFF